MDEAVDTYLFNSQVIIHGNHHILICPSAVKENQKTQALVTQWQENGYFDSIIFVPLQHSLMNGGGPACMRLTLILNEFEINQIPNQYFTSSKQLTKLESFIHSNYPESFDISVMDLKKFSHIERVIIDLFFLGITSPYKLLPIFTN